MSEVCHSSQLLANDDLVSQPVAEKQLDRTSLKVLIVESYSDSFSAIDIDQVDQADVPPVEDASSLGMVTQRRGAIETATNMEPVEHLPQEPPLPLSNVENHSRDNRVEVTSPNPPPTKHPLSRSVALSATEHTVLPALPLSRSPSTASLTRSHIPERHDIDSYSNHDNISRQLQRLGILDLPSGTRFEAINNHIRSQTLKCINRVQSPTRFVTPGTPEKLLTGSVLRSLFSAVLVPERVVGFLHQVERLTLHPIILALIELEWDPPELERLERFYAPFLEQGELEQAIPRFPFEWEVACDIFGNARGSSFFYTQHCYSPAILQNGEDAIVPKSTPLPFVREQKLDGGHDGQVMLWKLVEGGWKESDGTIHPGCKRIAVKKFSNVHYFRRELRIYTAIQKDHNHKSLTSYLGSLIHGTEHGEKDQELRDDKADKEPTPDDEINDNMKDTEHNTEYMIFLPLADGNLDTLLTRPGTSWGTNVDAIRLLGYAADLCGGLVFLHTQLHDAQGFKIEVIHGDIKPQNILYYGKEDKPWRLTDFGFSKIVEEGRIDTSPAFPNGTFNSPEAFIEARVTVASDIWSLAAVLTEVVTYIVGGPELVVKFRDKRKFFDERNHRRDRFFQGSGPSARVNEHVTSWLRHLRQLAEKRDVNFGTTIDVLLTELELSYLVVNEEVRRRKGAEDVRILLLRAVKLLKNPDCEPSLLQTLQTLTAARALTEKPATAEPVTNQPNPGLSADTAETEDGAVETTVENETNEPAARTIQSHGIPSGNTSFATGETLPSLSDKPLPPTPSLRSRVRRLKIHAKKGRQWIRSKLSRSITTAPGNAS